MQHAAAGQTQRERLSSATRNPPTPAFARGSTPRRDITQHFGKSCPPHPEHPPPGTAFPWGQERAGRAASHLEEHGQQDAQVHLVRAHLPHQRERLLHLHPAPRPPRSSHERPPSSASPGRGGARSGGRALTELEQKEKQREKKEEEEGRAGGAMRCSCAGSGKSSRDAAASLFPGRPAGKRKRARPQRRRRARDSVVWDGACGAQCGMREEGLCESPVRQAAPGCLGPSLRAGSALGRWVRDAGGMCPLGTALGKGKGHRGVASGPLVRPGQHAGPAGWARRLHCVHAGEVVRVLWHCPCSSWAPSVQFHPTKHRGVTVRSAGLHRAERVGKLHPHSAGCLSSISSQRTPKCWHILEYSVRILHSLPADSWGKKKKKQIKSRI